MYRIDISKLIYLTIYELKLFAVAKVNGKNTLAYLDTGATQVTVSQKMAKQLPRTGKTKIRSAFGEEEFETVSVNVEFLENQLANVKARIRNDDVSTPFQTDITLDGNILFERPLIYDFHILGLLPAEEVNTKEWNEISSKFLDKGLCILKMNIRGNTVNALFDTGAGITVINSRHVEENRFILKKGYEMEITDATGTKSKQMINICRGLQIGGIEHPPFDSIVIDLQDIEEPLGERIDLVFGANAMLRSGLRWSFNKARGKVYIIQ